MKRAIRRKYIDYEGFCQLTYVGRLLGVPGPKENIVCRAYFTPVLPPTQDDSKRRRNGKAFARDMPIGDIIDLPLGTLFHDGRPIPQTAGLDDALFGTTSFHALNLTEDNLRFKERWECVVPRKLLIPRGPSSLPEDPYYDGTFLCVGAGGDPYAYLIPSYEVFRFFYAVSSRMAQVLLDSRFIEFSKYVWDPDRSKIDHDTKEAILWLRQWMLDQDAWFIASLAFAPDAIERAKNLYRSIAVNQSRLLLAVPPMEGWINVRATWLPINNGAGGQSKVIMRLISTDWAPPFKSLKFDRDNDGRSVKTEEDGTDKPTITRLSKIVTAKPLQDNSEDPIDLTDAPSNPDLQTETVPLEEVGDRFEWLPQAVIEKLPQLETEYEGERYRAELIKRWLDVMSSFQGTTSAQAIRSVVLTAEDKHILASVESAGDELEPPSEPPQTPNNEFLDIVRGLANVYAKTDAMVKFLVLWDPPIPVPGENIHVFKLPKKIKDEAPRWLFKANSDRTRYALAARISRRIDMNDGRSYFETRYLLDFEPKQQPSSIVILWTESGGTLSNEDLRHVIRGFAQAKSVRVNRTRIPDLRMGHRKHMIPPEEIANGIGLLNRIFETKASRS